MMNNYTDTAIHAKNNTLAYCFRDGVIGFAEKLPEGAIEIASCINKKRLYEFINVRARHGYKQGVLLVPGVPEAKTDNEALSALIDFINWISSKPRPDITFSILEASEDD
ncbi:hypothetical protein [uncultured Acinetobacter sp.]|uniref:hypothetical protein n=1 Tax=uncultured Acinetobacter sp. TaxID=165433 RepID=UPI003749E645